MANPSVGPYRYRLGDDSPVLFDSDTLLDAIIHTLDLNYEVEIRDAPAFPQDVPAFLADLYDSALLLVDQPRTFWMDALNRTSSFYSYNSPYGYDSDAYELSQFQLNTGILEWISDCGGTMIHLGGQNGRSSPP